MSMSATRLYASAIAIVSGVYAMASSTSMMGVSGIGGSIMLAVGAVVLLHGAALLTPVARSLGTTSGPLMLVWATVMLLQQALAAAGPSFGMPGAPMGDGSTAPVTTWDAGMVAIAILMLVSGAIMTTRRSESGM